MIYSLLYSVCKYMKASEINNKSTNGLSKTPAAFSSVSLCESLLEWVTGQGDGEGPSGKPEQDMASGLVCLPSASRRPLYPYTYSRETPSVAATMGTDGCVNNSLAVWLVHAWTKFIERRGNCWTFQLCLLKCECYMTEKFMSSRKYPNGFCLFFYTKVILRVFFLYSFLIVDCCAMG